MENYLEIYSQWYPTTYRLKDYPREVQVIYPESKRSRLLEKLSSKQRGLIERHRRYLVRSLFLSKQFLKETDWEFYDLKTDHAYHMKNRVNKLYCKCGRPLKYQFIVRSRKSKKEICLGITHFSDHLKISPKVANEIKQGITTVDIAMDDLLYLINKGYKFPEDLWRRYCIALYRNNTLDKPAKLNSKLLKRLIDFRECQMPIFTGDYRATLDEISKVYKIALFESDDSFVDNKSTFETYCSDLSSMSKHDIFHHDIFLSEDVNVFLVKMQDQNVLESESVVNEYVDALYDVLIVIEKMDHYAGKEEFDKFVTSSAHSKLIDSRITFLIYHQFIKYKWNDNFYLNIPKLFRNKLQNLDQKKNFKSNIVMLTAQNKNVVAPIYKVDNELQDENGLELVNDRTKSDVSEKIIKLENNKVFFEFLYNILFLPQNVDEETIVTLLDLLFETVGLDDWSVAYSLVEARNNYLESNNIENAYQCISNQIYDEIKSLYTRKG